MFAVVTVEESGRRWSRRLSAGRFWGYAAIWRSPLGQPRWARPLLLLVAVLAGVGYAWGANSAVLEPFYGAAARSMSQSWHDFLFGAFDPLGTITVDKLPGALWIQALSLRVFGFHVWAVVLPQIVEGVLSVLVLYRAVRRLAGPLAGIAAVIVLAATPVTMELNRGNVSDSLLILLTVLAADATSAAIITGRLRTLLLAGFWVGLAFQTKMLQAWFVTPAFALPYLLFAPAALRVRVRHVLLAGLLMVVVSLSWMSVVSVVPSNDRPYVDGSRNNSLFSQVFVYNGYARLGRSETRAAVGHSAFFAELGRSPELLNGTTATIRPSWHRILAGRFGRDIGWLLPAAGLAALLLFWERRRAARNDRRLACLVLWSAWLLILGVSFSSGIYINSYYLAALSPAIAAICGLGADLYWRHRSERTAQAVLAVALAATAGYGVVLLAQGLHVPPWILPSCLAITAVGILAVAVMLRASQKLAGWLGAVALASFVPFSACASATVVSEKLGPFSVPYGPRATAHRHVSLSKVEAETTKLMRQLQRHYGTRIALANYTSALTSNYILYSGMEVLPIGGYTGLFPSPTVKTLARLVATGQVRLFQVPIRPKIDDPRVTWIRNHCRQIETFNPIARDAQLAAFVCQKAGR
jgi:4-amino-4-deoxy-L-arabinose transferase-like glycosyltransferase